MKVYILGIDHEIQVVDGRRTSEEKAKFADLLNQILTAQAIDFIGDETYPHRPAIAKALGEKLGIAWEPIEMTEAARKELGIAHEQASRYEPIFEDNLVVGSKPQRVLSDAVREEYMLWRTLTKGEDASSVLLLCGFMHTEHLGKLFEREGHQVILDSLCAQDWYNHTDCPES